MRSWARRWLIRLNGRVNAHRGSAGGVTTGAHQLHFLPHAFAVGAAVFRFGVLHGASACRITAFLGTGDGCHVSPPERCRGGCLRCGGGLFPRVGSGHFRRHDSGPDVQPLSSAVTAKMMEKFAIGEVQFKLSSMGKSRRGQRLYGLNKKDGFLPHPFDLVHGVRTSGLISGQHLKTGSPHDRHTTAYYGVAPSVFYALMRRWCRIRPTNPIEKTTFLDIGAGMGRAILR
jgi:hypothetical protein